MKGTCTADQFWACVAEIGWQDKNPNRFYSDVEKRLTKEWDNDFIASFRDRMDDLYSELYKVVDEFERAEGVSCGCGDDGFSDLLHHVIGLGKEEYEAALKDPMRVVKRGQEYRYEESFSYCIPYPRRVKEELTFEQALAKARELHGHDEDGEDEDTELFLEMEALELMMGPKAKLTARYYAAWAKRDLPDLKALWHSDFAGEFAPDLVNIIGILERVAEGEVGVVFDNPDLKDRVEALREKRELIYERELKKLEVLRSRGWSLDNLIGDIHEYLGEDNAA